MDVIDRVEQEHINNPLLRIKKRKVILWFKTSFTEFIELYVAVENITTKLKQSGVDYADRAIASLHELKDLVDVSHECINTGDDKLVNEFSPSMLNDYLYIISKVEEAKLILRMICDLSGLATQSSSEAKKISKDEFDNRMSHCLDGVKMLSKES